MTSIENILTATNATQQQAAPLVLNSQPTGSSTFSDVLDALNPLQHIPVVSNLYRAISGSPISATSQVAGDTLYGAAFGGVSAVLGFASSMANVAVKQVTGADIGQHVVTTINAASNAISSSLTPSSAADPLAAKATPLVANSGSIIPSAVAANASGTIANATNLISHPNALYTNSQYQRVQAFDAINKQLVKMAV